MTNNTVTRLSRQRNIRLRHVLWSILVSIFALISFIFFSATLFKMRNLETDFFSKKFSRILIVFAHADDEVTNAGLIKHWADLGAELKILTLTDGSANPNSDISACLNGEDIKQCRFRELNESAKILQINRVVAPGLPDSQLINFIPAASHYIQTELSTFAPEAILTMEPSGLNGLADHRAAFLAVAQALRASKHRTEVYLSTLPEPFSWVLRTKIPSIGFGKPKVFPLSALLRETKVQSALAHKSQYSTINGLSLGLGPNHFFRWIDFETYSVQSSESVQKLISVLEGKMSLQND